MQYSAEERIRELEAELASARAEVKELKYVISGMGFGAEATPKPSPNAAVEGADAPDAPKDAA